MIKFLTILKYEMDESSAQLILNSLYTIILGFAVNEVFLKHQLTEHSFEITFYKMLIIIITTYYFIDWFSYNAIKFVDKTYENIEVLLSAFFILVLGFLLAQTQYLKEYNLIRVKYYGLISGIYFIVTSIFSFFRLSIKITENEIKITGGSFLVIESILRIIIGFIFIYICFFKNKIQSELVVWFIILYVIILIAKFYRYYRLLKLKSNQSKTNPNPT